MPLNPALQGKTYPRVRFAIEPERVRAFALAIGHPGDDVPPTFATAPEIAGGLANAVADHALGLDMSRVLHGEQSYEWRRPLRVGETLLAESTIERIRSKGGLGFLTLRTDLRDEAGETVVVAENTLIVREGA